MSRRFGGALDICRRIVESLGGTIELAEGGPGATFVVRLPRAAPATAG